MTFEQLCKELEASIQASYEAGTTMEEAERLAAKTLSAQFAVSERLKSASLDTSMRKSGLKAIRAAVYLENATKTDKKPSDVLLAAQVDVHEVVQAEQDAYDRAVAESEALERYYNIFQNAHIYYRGVAKGSFGV
jgi:hypothetical protein